MSVNAFLAIGTVTAGVFTETAVGGGYARQPITVGRAINGRAQGIGNNISFTTTNFAQFNAFAFWTLVSGGTNTMTYPLPAQRQIGTPGPNSATMTVAPGDFVIDVMEFVSADGLTIDSGGANTLAGLTYPNFTVGNLTSTAFITESAVNGLTAFAGGGQGSATPISVQTARVTTVATVGDSVKLPASAAGLEMLVMNHGTNAMQVFGTGTDTIDDVATATGVSQMANSLVIYSCANAGAWYSEGLATGFVGGLQTLAFANSLTATGSTQAGALALTAMVNRVTTVAASTGVRLPTSAAGLVVTVTNVGANPLAVYGGGTDTINGVATATGITMQPNSVAVFTSAVAGLWETDSVGQGFAGNLPTVSSTNGITAFAGGGQGSATALTTILNRITTVATAGDSVRLPSAVAGLQITVSNAAAANSVNVFPASGEQINASGANVSFGIAVTKTATFSCAVAGQWHSVLSA